MASDNTPAAINGACGSSGGRRKGALLSGGCGRLAGQQGPCFSLEPRGTAFTTGPGRSCQRAVPHDVMSMLSICGRGGPIPFRWYSREGPTRGENSSWHTRASL